jgi:hypothetical protein
LFGRKKEKIEQKETKKIETIEVDEPFLIPENEIPEKQLQEFINIIEITRQKTAHLSKAPVLYQNEKTGKIKVFYVDIFLPLKTKDEVILWYRAKHEGVFDKKLRGFDVVTNYRAYYYDLTQPYAPMARFLSGVEDVVINNQKRYSTSQRNGSFSGIGARGTFVGSSSGISKSMSQTIGDVNIMDEGQIQFTFFSVEDPNGLSKLLKHIIKNRAELYEKLEEQHRNYEKEKTNKDAINCENCGTANLSNSKFCNKCGLMLNKPCSQCGKVNPADSSFCNECGFALQ